MKRTPVNQIAYLLGQKRVKRNVQALLRYLIFLAVVVAACAALFHLIMYYVEGRTYPWITGFYWTLVTMSTLGYGEITFQSVIGQLYSIFVLMTGIVMLLVVLPFTFIRFFYAPWLESQIRTRIPRELPHRTKGHVIICGYDAMAEGLIGRLAEEGYHSYVIETDEEVASEYYFAGLSVVSGPVDSAETYSALRAENAAMVFANRSDAMNTNIVLTVREVAPEVPIVAKATEESAVAVLTGSGATHVLPVRQWLGEQLANRINAGHTQVHIIASYEDLKVGELPMHHTPLIGKTIRETNLREHSGVSIVGIWERGRLQPVEADYCLTPTSVLAVVGTEAQLEELNDLFSIYDTNTNPVIVVGGSAVGAAAVRALHRREIPVHLIERNAVRGDRLAGFCRQVFRGNAADPVLLEEAGIKVAPSVLLATARDEVNIYLAAQCRRLNPGLRIVSRVTQEHNLETIHNAGADFVLGSASIGVEATVSILQGKELMLLGEGVEMFSVKLPRALHRQTLARSGIGARTGLNVVAIRQDGKTITSPAPSTVLQAGAELLVFGDGKQRQAFREHFAR